MKISNYKVNKISLTPELIDEVDKEYEIKEIFCSNTYLWRFEKRLKYNKHTINFISHLIF